MIAMSLSHSKEGFPVRRLGRIFRYAGQENRRRGLNDKGAFHFESQHIANDSARLRCPNLGRRLFAFGFALAACSAAAELSGRDSDDPSKGPGKITLIVVPHLVGDFLTALVRLGQ
jgi:hypothetical protein